MGKTNSKTSRTSASIKEKKTIIELRQVLQTPGFTDECHDIFDPVIHKILESWELDIHCLIRGKIHRRGEIFTNIIVVLVHIQIK